MKRTLMILAMLISPAVSMAAPHRIDWQTPSATVESASTPVVYYFRTANSVMCKEVEEDVWRDDRVADVARNFKCFVVHADSEAHRQLVSQMGVYWVPCVIVMEGGKEARRLERNVSREDYLRFLNGEKIVAPSPSPVAASAASATRADDAKGDGKSPELDFTALSGSLAGQQFKIEVTLAAKPSDVLTAYNIFLDTDGNAKTGYAAGDYSGADFMLQDKFLHRFTGTAPTEWAWERIGPAEFAPTASGFVYTVPTSQLGNPGAVSVFANSQAQDWSVADWAPTGAPLRIGGSAEAPTAPPSTSGGGSLSSYNDPKGDTTDPALDLVAATATASGPDLIFVLQLGGGSPTLNGMHVMIDADASNATGFSDGGRQGADFMIEGMTLYRHDAAPGPNWNWKNVGTVTASSAGTNVTLTVPRSRIGVSEGSRINIWFSTTDSSWNPADFLPDNGMERFPQ
ncbi:hypothetical protein GC173_06280 [bacterium]|nr:hypothetical protein [bacterium]